MLRKKKKLSRGRDVKCWKRAEILDMQVTEVIFGKRDEGNEGASVHVCTGRAFQAEATTWKETLPCWRKAGVLCGPNREGEEG